MPHPAHDRQLRQWLDELDCPAPEPLPLVTCAGCRHFTPDRINRVEGMGFCPIFRGYNYSMAKRYCREFEEKADARDQA